MQVVDYLLLLPTEGDDTEEETIVTRPRVKSTTSAGAHTMRVEPSAQRPRCGTGSEMAGLPGGMLPASGYLTACVGCAWKRPKFIFDFLFDQVFPAQVHLFDRTPAGFPASAAVGSNAHEIRRRFQYAQVQIHYRALGQEGWNYGAGGAVQSLIGRSLGVVAASAESRRGGTWHQLRPYQVRPSSLSERSINRRGDNRSLLLQGRPSQGVYTCQAYGEPR